MGEKNPILLFSYAYFAIFIQDFITLGENDITFNQLSPNWDHNFKPNDWMDIISII